MVTARRIFERVFSAVAGFVHAIVLAPVNAGVAAIVEQGGKVLLVRHSYRSGWLLPGGALDRGEAPSAAVIRELKEEIGLTGSAPPALMGVYVRRRLWITRLVLVYRVRDAVFRFTPNLEIREVMLADPAKPPPGTGRGVCRRFKELTGEATLSPDW